MREHLHGRNITHRVGSVLYSHEGTLTWPQHNTQSGIGVVLTLTWPQHSTQSGVGVVLT